MLSLYLRNSTRITHVQNLSPPIPGFQPEYQGLMVMKTLEAISLYVLPHSLDDENLIFVSRQPLKSDVQISILDIIGRCYRDGHQFSPS